MSKVLIIALPVALQACGVTAIPYMIQQKKKLLGLLVLQPSSGLDLKNGVDGGKIFMEMMNMIKKIMCALIMLGIWHNVSFAAATAAHAAVLAPILDDSDHDGDDSSHTDEWGNDTRVYTPAATAVPASEAAAAATLVDPADIAQVEVDHTAGTVEFIPGGAAIPIASEAVNQDAARRKEAKEFIDFAARGMNNLDLAAVHAHVRAVGERFKK